MGGGGWKHCQRTHVESSLRNSRRIKRDSYSFTCHQHQIFICGRLIPLTCSLFIVFLSETLTLPPRLGKTRDYGTCCFHPIHHPTSLSHSRLGNSSSSIWLWRMAFRYILALNPETKGAKKENVNKFLYSLVSFSEPQLFLDSLSHTHTLSQCVVIVTHWNPPLALSFSLQRIIPSYNHFRTYFNSDNIFSIFPSSPPFSLCVLLLTTTASSSLVWYYEKEKFRDSHMKGRKGWRGCLYSLNHTLAILKRVDAQKICYLLQEIGIQLIKFYLV